MSLQVEDDVVGAYLEAIAAFGKALSGVEIIGDRRCARLCDGASAGGYRARAGIRLWRSRLRRPGHRSESGDRNEASRSHSYQTIRYCSFYNFKHHATSCSMQTTL